MNATRQDFYDALPRDADDEQYALADRIFDAVAVIEDATPAPEAGAEERLRAAVEYGYQRGHADMEFGRGYRPTLAMDNYEAELRDSATLRSALHDPASSGTREETDD